MTSHSPVHAGAEWGRGKEESIGVGHGSQHAQSHVDPELLLGGGHDHRGVHFEPVTNPER
jgi:hypothetical protein